ncbi:Phosphatidate cytidylyltransferase [Actinidia chinensis var. chinensis]|uniref:Phosphatidate cytidylyltransferase n=1 Tax=Actinidia chinensis var. chinensis TaxID=1590841 RepID=A0A2R6PW89_ACTCC|nr:Phosphatidate cytidylyltransferase [Actinidia chinensis var. chinensis]
MVAELWFRSLWKTQRKREGGPDVLIGVLAFEVASLMVKLVHIWKSLSDKNVVRLREEIKNSIGIRKLVSDDDDYIVRLICSEMIDSLGNVARAVGRIAKKCNDPALKNFEHVFDDLIKCGVYPEGWLFTWKKMERKVKKMERFISMNGNLYQEIESLSDLEHTLMSMKGSDDSAATTLVEYQKKVAWKRQEMKQLKGISLWNRTYDYAVHLLARSVFTIYSRIGHVFGIGHIVDAKIKELKILDSDYIHRSQSVSSLVQSSVHPSENSFLRFSSGPLGNLTTKSGPITRTNGTTNFYLGLIGSSIPTSNSNSIKSKATNFFSGPLGRSTTKSGPLPRIKKTALKLWQTRDRDHSSTLKGKKLHPKTNSSTPIGPFKGSMVSGNSSPVKKCLDSGGDRSGTLGGTKDQSIINSKHKLLNPSPGTLGFAALALHYANVIIVIERLVASPHLIGHDARDDLYNMLPASVRSALRARLKPYTKSLTSSIYDTVLATEWTDAMSGILEWLAPLAHNMIRWQSERSFEHQNLVSKTNVLLVQTLYFADQEKTEATITELLVGLNYVWRFGKEINAKAILKCASGRTLDNCLDLDG